jgi:2-amino-4-hydroxy-6-hydroxymethyldihydropteridine diphosphokinase
VTSINAYIGLGSNLGDRMLYLDQALKQLDDGPGTWLLLVGERRETDPVGFREQPCFLNTVALIGTVLSPRELLNRLFEIERKLGRTRDGPRFGPRTIDLDLLLYGDDAIDEDGLTVPHPRMHQRRFVLEPLAEIAPKKLVIPGRGRVKDLLAELD